MLVLAFDTATDVATCALVDDGEVLAERLSRPASLLEDVDAMLRQAGARIAAVEGLAVGLGPGSFTSTRIGIAYARGLGIALDVPAAGVSTLAALAAGAEGAFPVVDARRREVFVAGPRVMAPDDVVVEPGRLVVGDGARRYRSTFEAKGAVVPSDESAQHLVRARFHAALAGPYEAVDRLEPIYVRAPDAIVRPAAGTVRAT